MWKGRYGEEEVEEGCVKGVTWWNSRREEIRRDRAWKSRGAGEEMVGRQKMVGGGEKEEKQRGGKREQTRRG